MISLVQQAKATAQLYRTVDGSRTIFLSLQQAHDRPPVLGPPLDRGGGGAPVALAPHAQNPRTRSVHGIEDPLGTSAPSSQLALIANGESRRERRFELGVAPWPAPAGARGPNACKLQEVVSHRKG